MENSQVHYNTMSKDMQWPFRIDPEFQNKIPPISEDEFRQLRENIISAGEVYEPLVVWDGVLVDGHNRWKVIQERPEVEWRIREMDFPDKWAAFDWMYKNQLGRRNLTDEQRTYMIGKMYEARKKSVGEHKGNQHSNLECAQSEHIPNQKLTRVSEQIAKEIGIGKETVKRAEKFAKGVDKLREMNPEAADMVLNSKADITKMEVQQISRMQPDEVQEQAEIIINPEMRQRKVASKISRVSVETEEDKERMAKIESIVKDMYDPSTAPEFTIDLLIEDIDLNAEIYVQLLENTLADRKSLLTDENKPRIAEAIDRVVEKIMKVREKL